VQEFLPVDSRKARVKYLTPEACAVEVMESVVQVSKYGAKTCAGNGVGVAAAAPPAPAKVVRIIDIAASATARRLRLPIRSLPP
jgi:hypothetical protein